MNNFLDIIIPAYNCATTLGRTLSSLEAQTDLRFNVTIIDDCSTEDILPIIDDHSKRLTIQYIRNKENVGCGMSRQVGIDSTNANYCTFLDSDDIFMPYAVETFNSCIESNPKLEYMHSYFYEQTIIDGNPAIVLHKDGFTWCHGKLYNVNSLRKYNIRERSDIRWADDSYINSICSELMPVQIMPLPMMLWTNTKTSVMRRNNPIRDAEAMRDFLQAMIFSCEHVLQYKSEVSHLPKTIDMVKDRLDSYGEIEMKLFEKLKKFKRGCV